MDIHHRFDRPVARLVLLGMLLLGLNGPSAAQLLGLPEAEQLALTGDPAIRQIQALSEAARERSVSAAQWPDPRLKLGSAALPLDTFDLSQEPMTQLQLGVQQHFPPGDTLVLRGRQLAIRAQALDQHGVDQELLTLRSVREDFLEVHYQRIAADIMDGAREIFVDLLAVTQDSYASGGSRQQDVFRAELELSRLEDRASRIAQAGDMARAQLAHWIGEAAYGRLDHAWPLLPDPPSLGFLIDRLEQHPRLLAHGEQVLAAEIGVEVAREQYKPGWMLDLTYGDRSGQNLDGSARADFLSAMVTMDLPLFRGKRQDRELAASIKEVDASIAARQDAYRHLRRAAERDWAALNRLDERLSRFSDHLLPEAAANADAAMAAYQSGVSDFTTLMRARITEYELQLDEARTRADRLMAGARLLYLGGERG